MNPRPDPTTFFGAKVKDDEEGKGVESDAVSIRSGVSNKSRRKSLRKGVEGDEAVVIFKHGIVTGFQVDVKDVSGLDPTTTLTNSNKPSGKRRQCCTVHKYDVGEVLQESVRAQGLLFAKVLSLENILHLLPLALVYAQFRLRPLHDFIYEEWIIILLLIVAMYITLVWSIVFNHLGTHAPSDNMLLVTKGVANGLIGMFLTAMLEREIVIWRLAHEDLPNPWAIINMKRASPYTYPFIVPLILLQVSLGYVFMTLFFLFCKGDVRKNSTLWVAFGFMALLGGVDFGILATTLKLQGPKGWDWLQFSLSWLSSTTWTLWRLFDLRQVILGGKVDVHEHSVKNLVLTFCL